jgi:hypothetical protein
MRKLCIGGLSATLLALGAGASTAGAAPVVRQASGANAAAIQAAVDQFRNDLGAANTGPPAASGRRQIVWDGVPDVRAAPSFMPEGQFRGAGAIFSTPGTGFQVSGDDDNPADTDPDQVEFSDTNAGYAADFAPFSPQRLFSPVGSNVTDTTFVLPGTATPAQTNGFGVVFSDVDLTGTTIELFAADGTSLGSFPVPAAGNGSETFSFLGVFFDAGERATLARITTGGAPLAAAPGGNDITQGGNSDIVVMDDFIFGEPQALPAPPGPDEEPPDVTVAGVPSSIGFSRFRRRGVRVRVTPDEATSYDVALLGSVGRLRLARNELILRARRLGESTDEQAVRLRPKRRLLRNAPDSFRVQVRIVATDAEGNTSTIRRNIRVRR